MNCAACGSRQAERRAYRVKEVAEMLGVPFRTFYRWVETGEVASARIGGCILIPAEEVERVLRPADSGRSA